MKKIPVKSREKKMFYGISLDINDLVGKTISSIEAIHSEFGRTYDQYIGVKCTDGTRVMISGDSLYDPKPPLEYMKETEFFTTDELIKKAEEEIREKAYQDNLRKERELREYQSLKEKLGLP